MLRMVWRVIGRWPGFWEALKRWDVRRQLRREMKDRLKDEEFRWLVSELKDGLVIARRRLERLEETVNLVEKWKAEGRIDFVNESLVTAWLWRVFRHVHYVGTEAEDLRRSLNLQKLQERT